MITLYGEPMSRAVRVLWMLRELELDFSHIETGWNNGDTEQSEFLALNPNGRIPVLDDEGFVIWESMAINLYLAEKYDGGFALASLEERAMAAQWSFWSMTEVEKAIIEVLFQRLIHPEEERSAAKLAEALEVLPRPFNVLNEQLANTGFLIGERFSVADLNAAAIMNWTLSADISLDEYPHTAGWLTRCMDRPAAQAVFT